MSSLLVRQSIKAAVESLASPWPVFDLSEYQTIDDITNNLTSEVVLIQYVVADDQVQSIGGYQNQGWEETGTVVLHMVVPTGFASSPVVTKGDAIRNGIRGKRLTSEVVVESCSPFVDFGGGGVDGAAHSYTANLFYTRRTCG